VSVYLDLEGLGLRHIVAVLVGELLGSIDQSPGRPQFSAV
jgi:hypothetical protein